MGRTGNLDKLTAVLGHDEPDALDGDLVLVGGRLLVSRPKCPESSAVCHAIEMTNQLSTLLLVPQSQLLAPRLFHSHGPRLCVLLVYSRVDQLHVAVGFGDPR